MKKPIALKILDVVTIIAVLGATAMVFFYAPIERVMGAVQKVFYFHVAAGWVGMLSFLFAAVAGVMYLVKKNKQWDFIGIAAIEIGIIFTATIMELVYIAYLMLRQGIEDPDRRARFGAVYAIVGFLSVPLTFFSIRIFRTIHPVVIAGSDPSAVGTFDMTSSMFNTLMVSIVVFSILFVDLVWHRIRLGNLSHKIEELKYRISE